MNWRHRPGKYFEDLETGTCFKHTRGRTITETDNLLFCAITMNDQSLHINEDLLPVQNSVNA
jgi:acyl dehydratase